MCNNFLHGENLGSLNPKSGCLLQACSSGTDSKRIPCRGKLQAMPCLKRRGSLKKPVLLKILRDALEALRRCVAGRNKDHAEEAYCDDAALDLLPIARNAC